MLEKGKKRKKFQVKESKKFCKKCDAFHQKSSKCLNKLIKIEGMLLLLSQNDA